MNRFVLCQKNIRVVCCMELPGWVESPGGRMTIENVE